MLETVARIPYFAYISILHLYESLGFWRAGADLRRVHFAEEWNELHHLQVRGSSKHSNAAHTWFCTSLVLLWAWFDVCIAVAHAVLSYIIHSQVISHGPAAVCRGQVPLCGLSSRLKESADLKPLCLCAASCHAVSSSAACCAVLCCAQIMESLGGDQLWFDRFLAEHAAILYYWVLIVMYLLSPKNAYAFSELVEWHATDTYTQVGGRFRVC